MTLSRSAVAACCSSASFSSRVSRTTSAWAPGGEPRRVTALDALRPFAVNALRGPALAALPPALEGLFIASARMAGTSILAGHSNTGHGTARMATSEQRYAYAAQSRAAASPAQPRQATFQRQTHPAAFLGRFSPILEAEYLSDVADAGLRALAT